jgi:predicted RNA-binding protein with RPS1 domain
VRVRDGLEGLIHISELSHQRVAHPGDVVREGQTIKLKIISLDSERHRLGLSLKQAEEPPARPAPEVARPRRPREERGYSMSDAVQEPEGGIDNTLAAAFAQVRQQLEQAERAAEPAAAPDSVAAVETESEPEVAEAVEPVAVAEVAEPVAVAEPEPEPIPEAVPEPEPAMPEPAVTEPASDPSADEPAALDVPAIEADSEPDAASETTPDA